MNQIPMNTHNTANKADEIKDRGLWLFIASCFTLSKYPCKSSFKFNFSITILEVITQIPLT